MYKVWGYLLDDGCLTRKSPYPKFNLNKVIIGFTESLPIGETMIDDFILEYKDFVTYCFYIDEFPIDKHIYQFCAEDVFYRRLYDSNGIYLEESVSSYYETDLNKGCGVFRGRISESLRFTEGDIVEVRNENQVELGIVTNRVMTIDRCWEIWKKDSDRYLLDSSDDQYTIYWDKENHSHISPLNILHPRFPISDYLRKKYQRIYLQALESKSHPALSII